MPPVASIKIAGRTIQLCVIKASNKNPHISAPIPSSNTPRSPSRFERVPVKTACTNVWALLQIVGGDKLIIPFC